MEELKHIYVPKHRLLNEEEKKKVIKKYGGISLFPKIKRNDPAIKHLKTKPGNMIEIERESPTAKKTSYYRIVVV